MSVKTETFGDRMELMKRMGASVGADVMEAVAERRLSPLGLRDAVIRCSACRSGDECRDWLDEVAERGAEAPPSYCGNAPLMRRLGRAGG